LRPGCIGVTKAWQGSFGEFGGADVEVAAGGSVFGGAGGEHFAGLGYWRDSQLFVDCDTECGSSHAGLTRLGDIFHCAWPGFRVSRSSLVGRR